MISVYLLLDSVVLLQKVYNIICPFNIIYFVI